MIKLLEEKGRIYTHCPYCGSRNLVDVEFPKFNKGFDPVVHTCTRCGKKMKVTDDHKYNEDGTIVGET